MSTEAKDILLDSDGDLLIREGDFVVGPSDDQHVLDILMSAPGDWRQSPLVGVNIITFLNAPMDGTQRNALRQKIALQLQLDGIRISEMDLMDLNNVTIKVDRP
ncbi:hypothetical protein BH09BAC1_BH09BAC1_05020 [soil metagenome]